MPDLAGLRRRRIVGTARARSVADRGTRDRIGGQRPLPPGRSRRRREKPAERRAMPRSERSRGGNARQIWLACEPLACHASTPYLRESPYRRSPRATLWRTATPPSSRSRRKCCSRPMPAAFFPWRTARTTRRSIGSSRRCAASFRSIVFTCRRGSPAPCAPTGSPSPSTATSTACSRAARSRSRTARAPGSIRASASSTASSTTVGIVTAWKSTRATPSSAVFMA